MRVRKEKSGHENMKGFMDLPHRLHTTLSLLGNLLGSMTMMWYNWKTIFHGCANSWIGYYVLEAIRVNIISWPVVKFCLVLSYVEWIIYTYCFLCFFFFDMVCTSQFWFSVQYFQLTMTGLLVYDCSTRPWAPMVSCLQ